MSSESQMREVQAGLKRETDKPDPNTPLRVEG